jgi:hydroxypyruvate reductase/glycerate 2-kinase
MRTIAEQLFLAGVESVLPDRLIAQQLQREYDRLQIAGHTFHLTQSGRIFVLAAGKAAALMAMETEKILGDLITDGHVVTKYGHGSRLSHLTLTEAGHPLPDASGVESTRRMLALARQAGKDDLVLCLLSGGASTLMADLPGEATLEDLKQANDLLVRCGADISEINTVRKHLSAVKGGQLAAAATPATVISLILSDVIGDTIDVIASGPTVPDSSTFADALAVLEKYALGVLFPATLLDHLRQGAAGLLPETPKAGDPVFGNVHNHIIGNNRLALEAAAHKAGELGFETCIITDSLQGDYTEAADFILRTLVHASRQNPDRKPLCLLFGGEPTLKVSGSGLGGRNQHLALYLATRLDPGEEITLLCAGTDGTDGPTDAAGAIIDRNTLLCAKHKNIDAVEFLSRFDSYHFFQQAGGHIITGNTRTNVMDMVVVLYLSPLTGATTFPGMQ